MATCGQSWCRQRAAWRLQAAHRGDRAAYRAALSDLAAQLRGGLLDAIAVEGWTLLEEIADVLAERLTP